ncbi:anti-virulence regulator CigR family protein [Pseudomonas sp. RGM2987]|uniref:anti-virulence regulator CigR family protein n=1 Tax=Pseudomonas sp. RGM2987 TaxID=2930090 RepID=UPI001FD63456|nr:anti-virulence regulator CigR family protein [Pseudomonas sp. RGM2987]MCJ8206251.1 RcnB family protein [Pseudomonas sp. RGM2987]
MSKLHSLIAVIACLTVVATSATVLADPGNGKGNAKFDQGQGHGQGGKGGQGNKGGKANPPGGDWHDGPSIDRGGVLGVIGGYRDYWRPGPALPPGIQKSLARGKPLPPGIAKKLDGRLLGRLPHYDGYEWQQVGTDLILVAIASGIIYEVLNGAFD